MTHLTWTRVNSAGPNITLIHALGAGYHQPAPPNGDFAAIAAATELGFTALPPRQVLDLLIGIVDQLMTDP